ncbi:uncharacterized protein LOC121050091 isoform X2 [Rosa chinensis]|uniref:uncharacterized protein LOC121050091 isoform X2 n=1 Tax=Rosa chinensis TaxID=74649 RepID=UPI001AD8D025|nr:uncharacterized protein LOC121050091 isoform X2 [Rosa chinensis]
MGFQYLLCEQEVIANVLHFGGLFAKIFMHGALMPLKKISRDSSLLILTSLPYLRSSFGMVIAHKNHEADRLKNVTLHQISSLIDSSLHEQKFVRRYFAKRFCRALEKSTLPFISDFPSGNVKFKPSPNWPNVLSDLENSSLAISCSKLNVFDCSSASSCKILRGKFS